MSIPYLSGEHTPVTGERTDRDLKVTGELPRELRGMFVRNSPNPQFEPQGRYHWFDGDGMVHGVQFEDGRAHYRNRYVRTRAFEAEREAGRALWRGIKEPVDLTNPLGPVKDTANTHLIAHHGRLLATWWLSGTPMALTLPDLDTVGPDTFGGTLKTTMAAHPKVDPTTGELIYFAYDVFRRPYVTVGVASADGTVVRSEPLDVPRPHVPHDIAMTENYIVVLDLPLGWDRAAMAQGKRRIGFDKSVPSRIGLLPRQGGAPIRWFEHDPCYVYHLIATYEQGDTVVIVACRIEDPIPQDQDTTGGVARLDHIELAPYLYRWILDLRTGGVRGERLDDVPTEFPRVNDRTWKTNARYSYNPRIARRPDLMFDGVIRYDLHRGGSVQHAWSAGWFGGEVVFAERPGANAEDDGWLVTVLTHADLGSRAVVLDASDVAAGPVATVELPWRIPTGFHAEWVPLPA
jgi:carotenoid cleavage dioxygenase-like enzyme